MACGVCGDGAHNRRTCPTLTPDAGGPGGAASGSRCGYCGEVGHTARRCAAKPPPRVVPAVEPGGSWDGAGQNLRGAFFDRWVVENPAPADARGLRVWVRCACGKTGVRHVADLARDVAHPCRACFVDAPSGAPVAEEKPRLRVASVPAPRIDRKVAATVPKAPPRGIGRAERQEELAAAVVELRVDADPDSVHWRTVERFVRQECRDRGDADRSDARQETLLTIFRCIEQVESTEPRAVSAWVHRIWKTRLIDASRRAQRHAAGKVTHDMDSFADEAGPFAHLLDRFQIVASALEDLDRQVVAYIAGRGSRHPMLHRAQARATILRRVLGLERDELRDALRWPWPVTDALLYKWVERGRETVLGALERWRAGANGERVADVTGVLVDLVSWRRADAGVPRARGTPQYGRARCAGPRAYPITTTATSAMYRRAA